ncbi:sugar ABC transporter substrate-binding protein [Amycolatopsis alkalitolerans]|uniref:Substrate-binding domain-containing protein n=1 Tax=Amycolatopsis alkalitolerans TaxID=2547244 RepID=A0A5C4M1V8_9PSEU|nr:substrate-binding domain-containing protein [Amycolatopsis alkalitolerans]TNC26868.1 substrate-binding domain-containing protein [Amycolatopsis alkalitolerans]
MNRKNRFGAVAVFAAVLALVLSACTTTDSSSGGDSGGAGLPADQLAQLQSLVDKASEVPTFVAPGPAFDISKAKGKRIFVIPTASQLPVCDQIGKDMVTLANKVGMSGTYFQNSGGPSGWIPGMQQAISQHYDAIVLICGIDPNLIKPQVQAATAAGIAVIDSGLGDTEDGAKSDPLVTAQTNIPNAESIRRSIDVAILEHKGNPFDVFEITSNEVPAGVVMDKALREELGKYCPDCKVKSVNIAVPDWATKVQSAVSSAILADPKIKAVVPIFDGEVPPASAAVKASGRGDVKLYGCYGGTPEYIAQMGGGIPMDSNVGPTHLWRAYATMDQTLRVLSGAGAVPADKDQDPSRLWTTKNYQEAAAVNGGFGTEFPSGYEKLWGLS